MSCTFWNLRRRKASIKQAENTKEERPNVENPVEKVEKPKKKRGVKE